MLSNKHVLVLSVVLAGSTAVSSGLQLWQPQIIKSYGLTNMQTADERVTNRWGRAH